MSHHLIIFPDLAEGSHGGCGRPSANVRVKYGYTFSDGQKRVVPTSKETKFVKEIAKAATKSNKLMVETKIKETRVFVIVKTIQTKC